MMALLRRLLIWPIAARTVAVVALALCGAVQAADLGDADEGEAEMGCALHLRGEITEGDAEALAVALDFIDRQASGTQAPRRLCLDSAMGDMLEATRLAEALAGRGWGAAVARGARCTGPCAVIFMAGVARDDGGTRPDRVLHPRGLLGFHAPPLDVPDGSAGDDPQALARAYRRALSALAEVVVLRTRRDLLFPDSLLHALLGTPPGGMTAVATVGQAARWGIAVAPVDLPETDDDGAFRLACLNARAAREDLHPEDLPDAQTPTAFRFVGLGEGTVALRDDGSTGAPCALDLRDGTGTAPLGEIRQPLRPFATPEAAPLQAYMLYPADHRLEDLPLPEPDAQATYVAALGDRARAALTETALDRCWVLRPEVTVVNVSEYVNLREEAGFSAPVLRQVPLGERLRVIGTQSLRTPGDESVAERCLEACDAVALDPADTEEDARVKRCIAANILWYEVRDSENRAGFVSRKFLLD